MNKSAKLKAKLLGGQGYHNVSFDDVVGLLLSLGFVHERTGGSHAWFTHPRIPGAVVNIQSRKGKAKPCQLRQVRDLIHEHHL